jgi:hypothetical protein
MAEIARAHGQADSDYRVVGLEIVPRGQEQVMALRLTNGVVLEEERRGSEITCLSCNQNFSYSILNISPGDDVYLYCDACSNFVLREEDRRELLAKLARASGPEIDLKIGRLYERLQERLPSCECGGRFALWNNIKCPHCAYEFPYNGGIRDKARRYREAKIIWLEGATAYRGALLPSNRLVKVIV